MTVKPTVINRWMVQLPIDCGAHALSENRVYFDNEADAQKFADVVLRSLNTDYSPEVFDHRKEMTFASVDDACAWYKKVFATHTARRDKIAEEMRVLMKEHDVEPEVNIH